MRRLLTRLLAIIPSMTVAVVLGRAGIDTLLVASQVVLSIVLPFIVFPLLYCTASRTIMSVRKTPLAERPDLSAGTLTVVELPSPQQSRPTTSRGLESGDEALGEVVDYSNSKLTIGVGAVIWLVVVAANLYVIVELGLGNGE